MSELRRGREPRAEDSTCAPPSGARPRAETRANSGGTRGGTQIGGRRERPPRAPCGGPARPRTRGRGPAPTPSHDGRRAAARRAGRLPLRRAGHDRGRGAAGARADGGLRAHRTGARKPRRECARPRRRLGPHRRAGARTGTSSCTCWTRGRAFARALRSARSTASAERTMHGRVRAAPASAWRSRARSRGRTAATRVHDLATTGEAPTCGSFCRANAGGSRGTARARRRGSAPTAPRTRRTGDTSGGSPDRRRTRPAGSRRRRDPPGFGSRATDPHAVQNTLAKPSSGSYARMCSSPASTRSEPGAIRAPGDAAVPVRRWQRVQWQ